MNRNEQRVYLAPEIEVNEISVEQGISVSLGGVDPNPTNPGENPILPDTDEDW